VLSFTGYYDTPARDPLRQNVALAFLVAHVAGEPAAGDDAEAAGWFPLDALPPLAFDHGRILADALRRVAPGA
jgi:8-oxo-dGTP diphosphatase